MTRRQQGADETRTYVSKVSPVFNFGVGLRFYFFKSIALRIEFRDYFYKANPGGLDVVTSDGTKPTLTGSDEYMTNNLYFSIGVSFKLPPGAKVSR